MSRDQAIATIRRYYAAFNAGDLPVMLAELTEGVEHHVNEGQVRRGKALFAAFSEHMARCYGEKLTSIAVFADDEGRRAAAEFTVNGTYLATDEGLPEARGQGYVLPAGAFFDLEDGRISRVTTYYNLAGWIAQVSR